MGPSTAGSITRTRGNGAGPALSVVVPVRNEAGNIAPLLAEIATALAGRRFEVVYVNDGSTDATEAELTRLMAVPSVVAADQAHSFVRAIGGGAHRRRGGATRPSS